MGIGAGIAAAAIIVILTLSQGTALDLPATPEQSTQELIVPQESTPDIQGPIENNAYRINTECELIYSLAYGVYPDDQKIPGVEINTLIEKYPDEFAEWEQILEDPDQRTEFFNQPLGEEFGNVLVTAMMKEISINPELKDIAILIVQPNGRAQLAEDFEVYSCQQYFDTRIN